LRLTDSKTTKHCRIEPVLWRYGAVSSNSVDKSELFCVEKAVTQEYSGHSKEASKSKGKKDQSRLLDAKPVDRTKDVRKGGEEGKEHSKIEGNIEAQEAYDRLSEQHMKRSY